MKEINRRSLLGMLTAAGLSGCGTTSVQMGLSPLPAGKENTTFFRGTPEQVRFYLEDRLSNNGEVFRDRILDQFWPDTKAIEKCLKSSSWTISVNAKNLISNRKHLFVTVACEDLDYTFLRFDGASAQPHLKDRYLELRNVGAIGIFDDSVLFGILSPPELDVNHPPNIFHYFMDQDKPKPHSGPNLTIYKGTLETVLDFLVVSSQFLVALGSLQQPYALLGTNSNAFAYSLLKHSLKDAFDETHLKTQIKEKGWVVPGYGNLLLPDASFNHYVRQNENVSMKDALEDAVIYQKISPHTVCDRSEELKIQGLMLAGRILQPFIQLFDIVENPAFYTFNKDSLLSEDPLEYRGPFDLRRSVIHINNCPKSAFKAFPS